MEATIFTTTDIQQLEESLQKIRKVIVDAFCVLAGRLKEIASAIDSHVESANQKSEEQRRNHARRLYNQSEKLRPLLIDRRLTVHRCRNCC